MTVRAVCTAAFRWRGRTRAPRPARSDHRHRVRHLRCSFPPKWLLMSKLNRHAFSGHPQQVRAVGRGTRRQGKLEFCSTLLRRRACSTKLMIHIADASPYGERTVRNVRYCTRCGAAPDPASIPLSTGALPATIPNASQLTVTIWTRFMVYQVPCHQALTSPPAHHAPRHAPCRQTAHAHQHLPVRLTPDASSSSFRLEQACSAAAPQCPHSPGFPLADLGFGGDKPPLPSARRTRTHPLFGGICH